MNSIIRRSVLFLGVVAVLGFASVAHADTIQVTLGGGLTGVLNLTVSPNGGGSYLVTSMTGSEKIGGTTMPVGQVVAPNSSGVFSFPPPAGGFSYDDLIFPSSNTVFDNSGLLFTLLGAGGTVYENLYSVGTATYLESAYLNNGYPFPYDFSYVPVTVSVSKLVVATPEPSTLVLCLAGFALLGGLIYKKSLLV
jgi:hypothetical protein